MIEVEKKFDLASVDIEVLLEDAKKLSHFTFKDTYYDTQELSLSLKDCWLRDRDGQYELKIPFQKKQGKNAVGQYHELETEKEIKDFLKLDSDLTLKTQLEQSGFMPLASFKTDRTKYTKNGFMIDIDQTDFDFGIGEIELVVETPDQVAEGVKKIEQFAKMYHLPLLPVRGKLVEYLKRFNKSAFNTLLHAKIIS